MIETIERHTAARSSTFSTRAIPTIGHVVLRYGLTLLLVSGGIAKFTGAEAEFIQPLMAHSPFLGWLYGVTSVQGASNLIGVVAIIVGLLLAVHRWWPWLAVLGGLAAAVQFVLLFGVAVWCAGESLGVEQVRRAR